MENYLETKKEKRENIICLFKNRKKGNIVTNEEINQFLEEDLNDEYGKKRFKSQMAKIKNQLINEGIAIKGIYGAGYYILKDNQVASYAYRNYVLKPVKTFKKAETLLSKSNTNNLSNDDLQKHKASKNLTCAIENAAYDLINCKDYKIITNSKEDKYNN